MSLSNNCSYGYANNSVSDHSHNQHVISIKYNNIEDLQFISITIIKWFNVFTRNL